MKITKRLLTPDGDGGIETTATLSGALDSIIYRRPGSGAYTTVSGCVAAVDIVFQDGSGIVISAFTGLDLDTENIWRPRVATHQIDGTINDIDTTNELIAPVPHKFADAKVRITVTNGGSGNTGNFLVIFEA